MVRPIAEPWKTSNLWLPVTGLITATPLNVVEAGFNTTSKDKGFDWKIDVVITSGIITVDFFSVEQGL